MVSVLKFQSKTNEMCAETQEINRNKHKNEICFCILFNEINLF